MLRDDLDLPDLRAVNVAVSLVTARRAGLLADLDFLRDADVPALHVVTALLVLAESVVEHHPHGDELLAEIGLTAATRAAAAPVEGGERG